MQVTILQSAGEHPENAQFREALSLQRGMQANGVVAYVAGPGYGTVDVATDSDIVIVLENYWRTEWLGFIKSRIIDRGLKCAFWSIDAHVPAAGARQVRLVAEQHIPLVFCSTHATQDMFRAVGAATEWLPNAYDDTLIQPTGEKKHDAGFCGRLIAGRKDWLSAVSKLSQEPIQIDEWVLGADMVRAQSSYRVGLNRAYNIDINYRCLEVCGCRTALLTNRVPQLEKVLRPGEHCIVYDTVEQCADKLRYLIEEPQTAELIAYRACAHVQKNHTYRVRARQILERMV